MKVPEPGSASNCTKALVRLGVVSGSTYLHRCSIVAICFLSFTSGVSS
jgi:hypothetical protein